MQGGNAEGNLDGGAFIAPAGQSNGNVVGQGLGSVSVVPTLLLAAGASSGGQAFAGGEGAMTHSSQQCAHLPQSQQLLPPNAPAELQPFQDALQPPDLGVGHLRANSRVQAAMQAGGQPRAPGSHELARLDPQRSAPPQGQVAVQQPIVEPGLQPKEQHQQQAAMQEHLHASPDGGSHKRPRRAAARCFLFTSTASACAPILLPSVCSASSLLSSSYDSHCTLCLAPQEQKGVQFECLNATLAHIVHAANAVPQQACCVKSLSTHSCRHDITMLYEFTTAVPQ
eukprot:1136213-Pelagomonas_calceolata.AAC.4